ncbi:hypothetical protein ACOSQ4_023533 [Xanthoceras sorbifolium]
MGVCVVVVGQAISENPRDVTGFEGLRDEVVDSVNETKKTFSPVKPSPCVKVPLNFKDVYGGTGSDRVLIDTILSVGKNPYYGVTREGFDAVSVFDRKPQVGITVKEEVDGVKASKCESLSEKRDLGSQIKEEVDGSNVCKDENLSGKDDVDFGIWTPSKRKEMGYICIMFTQLLFWIQQILLVLWFENV